MHRVSGERSEESRFVHFHEHTRFFVVPQGGTPQNDSTYGFLRSLLTPIRKLELWPCCGDASDVEGCHPEPVRFAQGKLREGSRLKTEGPSLCPRAPVVNAIGCLTRSKALLKAKKYH